MILIVKSTLAFYIVAACGALVTLAGCGQPGALYLPKPPPAKVAPAASATPPSPSSTAPTIKQ
jgi:predicted small lipoprotein YifL